MATVHKTFTLIGGDDLFINVQLLTADNDPYDLDKLDEIKWLVHSPMGEIVPHESVMLKTDAPNGRLRLWLPSASTTEFDSGVYTDWLRIVCGGIVSTLLTGPISITADPWKAPVQQTYGAIEYRGIQPDAIIIHLNDRERIVREAANDDNGGEALPWVARTVEIPDETLPMPPVAPISGRWDRRSRPVWRSTSRNFATSTWKRSDARTS